MNTGMCKHKSGGMSKATESSSQEGSPERATSNSSPNSPLSTNETVGSQISNPHNIEHSYGSQISNQANVDVPYVSSISNQPNVGVPYGSQISSQPNGNASYVPQRRTYVTSHIINMQSPNCNNACDTFTYLPNNDTLPCDSKISFLPNVQESRAPFLESQDSEEEDTEQSPMLLKDTCNMYYNNPQSWHPNILCEDKMMDHNVLSPDHFNNCDPYSCQNMDLRDKAANCDNFTLYQNYQPQTVFQEHVSYIQTPYHGAAVCPSYLESTINNFDEVQVTNLGERNYATKHKKKWMLNQKCKSADSEPDSFGMRLPSACKRGINYNYMQQQNANILETHIDGHNTYLKSMYSSEGDPIAGPSGLQRPCSINWEIGANVVDSEFRSRSYSLTPTINFAVFESESSSEAEDLHEPMIADAVVPAAGEMDVKTIDDPFDLPVMSLNKVLAISPSAAQLSIASSYGDNGSPICKICHMTARENDPLISPCRCSGTMQYIHCGCLMRWLEVCHKRGRRPASCELCQYQYHWHKKFKIRHWQFPQCSRKDKILHMLFIFSVLLMVSCASLTIMFFKQDKGTKVDFNQELTQAEIGNLICGVLFFVAFFVAIYVEAKSHDTLYKLLVKFIHINQQWYIDEYEKKETAPVAV